MRKKQSKEQRDATDEAVCRIIKHEPCAPRAGQIAAILWLFQKKKAFGISRRIDVDRAVDRSLQRLRKAGRIQYVAGRWYPCQKRGES